MPVLELRNKDGELDGWSLHRLLAVMAHPSDRAPRDHYLARINEKVHAVIGSETREELKDSLAQFPIEGEQLLVSAVGGSFARELAKIGGFAALARATSYDDSKEGIIRLIGLGRSSETF